MKKRRNLSPLHWTQRAEVYRVIGIDNSETWPRQVRLAGEPWDYPEMNAIMNPQSLISYIGFQPSSTTVYSFDGLSSVPGPNGLASGGTLALGDLATTATIFTNVVAVYPRIVTIE